MVNGHSVSSWVVFNRRMLLYWFRLSPDQRTPILSESRDRSKNYDVTIPPRDFSQKRAVIEIRLKVKCCDSSYVVSD